MSTPSSFFKAFGILVISFYVALSVAPTLMNGMFFDGVTYAAISNNLANGFGTAFTPRYTPVFFNHFFEHPPLVFWIQSLFFIVLGSSIYSERIFALTIELSSLIIVYQIYKTYQSIRQDAAHAWFALFLLATVPVFHWAHSNNMLEITMNLFTLISFYFITKTIQSQKIAWIPIASFFLFAAFLAKGPVALFPMASFVLFAWSQGNFKDFKPYLHSFLLVLFLILFACITFLSFPELWADIQMYLKHQLFASLNNKRELTTDNRFRILFELVTELLPAILIVCVIYFTTRTKTEKSSSNQLAFFFLLVGLSASLPIVVSLKQRSFYLIPALPFFALAFTLFLHPYINTLVHRISIKGIKVFQIVTVSCLIVSIIASLYSVGKFSRDESMLKDVYALKKVLPENTVISATSSIVLDWSMVAYMSRHLYSGLENSRNRTYLLCGKNEVLDTNELAAYNRFPIELQNYILYKKK